MAQARVRWSAIHIEILVFENCWHGDQNQWAIGNLYTYLTDSVVFAYGLKSSNPKLDGSNTLFSGGCKHGSFSTIKIGHITWFSWKNHGQKHQSVLNHRCPKFPLVGWLINRGLWNYPWKTTGKWFSRWYTSHRPKPQEIRRNSGSEAQRDPGNSRWFSGGFPGL